MMRATCRRFAHSVPTPRTRTTTRHILGATTTAILLTALTACQPAGTRDATTRAAEPAAPVATPPSPVATAQEERFDSRCVDRAQRPTRVVLSCADAGSTADRLTWTTWEPQESRASGVLVENDCAPTCLGGTKRAYPATFRFYAPQQGKFTTVDIRFDGAGPGGQRSRTSYL